MSKTEKLDRLISEQVVGKWKCPVNKDEYMEIKKINYLSDHAADVIIGCSCFEKIVYIVDKDSIE
jgi:hypothetical protein